MKKLIFGLLFAAGTFSANATTWDIDAGHSSVNFRIEHLGITWVAGHFTSFNGSIDADKADFSDMKINLNIVANSIATGIGDRDAHLNGEDFLNTGKFENITFKSTKVTAGKDGKLTVEGELTMLGVSAPITLDAKYNGTVKDMYGNTKAGFEVSGLVDRYGYGIKYNAPLEGGGMALGQNVELMSYIELMKK